MPELELTAGTIDYEDTGGAGPVLVLLGGVLMDGSVWDPVVADLRRDHRCVVPTLPLGAHRRPMRRDADLSLSGFGRMVAEVLERLDLREVTLVENDHAAALALAGRSPGRVARLVISSCEVFENYPPGLPGKNLRLTAMVPGGLFLAVQAMRLRAARRLPVSFGLMAKRPLPGELVDRWLEPPQTQPGVRRDLRNTRPALGAVTCWRSASGWRRSTARRLWCGRPRIACSAPNMAGASPNCSRTQGSSRYPTATR